jgi:hypothetical protein
MLPVGICVGGWTNRSLTVKNHSVESLHRAFADKTLTENGVLWSSGDSRCGISRIDLVFSLWNDMASFGRAPACYMVINSSFSVLPPPVSRAFGLMEPLTFVFRTVDKSGRS